MLKKLKWSVLSSYAKTIFSLLFLFLLTGLFHLKYFFQETKKYKFFSKYLTLSWDKINWDNETTNIRFGHTMSHRTICAYDLAMRCVFTHTCTIANVDIEISRLYGFRKFRILNVWTHHKVRFLFSRFYYDNVISKNNCWFNVDKIVRVNESRHIKMSNLGVPQKK